MGCCFYHLYATAHKCRIPFVASQQVVRIARNKVPHRSRHTDSTEKGDFDPRKFLATVGDGKQGLTFAKKQTIVTQEEDLVDQLFNSSERRLARLLLLLARFGKEGAPTMIPKISQETLAEMIGTTRPRVSFFMNRFRELGFVEYGENGIQVHRSLLNVALHD